MVDPALLSKFGSTRERLREVLTASGGDEPVRARETAEERKERKDRDAKRVRDIQSREKIEGLLQSRIYTGIDFSLRNQRPYAAVDLAWDSIVLNKINMPLLLYAQGRIDVQRAVRLLETSCPNGNDYIIRNEEKKPVGINLPKFIEAEVNMVRSMINRRWSAQKNKYANLWPYYNYEPRTTGLPGKCRADVLSQRVDIMVDQFGVRHHDNQVMLDGLLYGHSVDFVRGGWEVDKQLRVGADGSDETYIEREGVGWNTPHASRIFWDRSHPLVSLNSNSGCQYVGFWDVVRYADVDNDPHYFNKDRISFGNRLWGNTGLLGSYFDYFNQYNYAISAPVGMDGTPVNRESIDVATLNDTKSAGLYSHTNRDSSMFLTNYYHYLVPKEWGIGDYPWPVWLRIVCASESTPVFAEFISSLPAAVLSINENDSRAVSISMAMDVMQYQQHMTNLLTHFMSLLQIEAFKAIGINTDALEEDQIKKIENILGGQNWPDDPVVFRFSLLKKLEQLGIAPAKAMTEVITISQGRQGQSINTIFEAMIKLLELAERMQAMSSAEMGQSEPREISATQTNIIANTTQSIYSSISDCIDDFRETKKRIIYETLVSCSEGEIEVPVKNRYTKDTIAAAGFSPKAGEDEDISANARRHTVIGSAKSLVHQYIFSSRDGSERAVNTQAANTLVQLLAQILAVPEMVQAMGKEKLYSMFNEVFRMSGAGVDLNVEMSEGEDGSMGQNELSAMKQSVDQLTQLIQQLAQQTQKNSQDVAEQVKVNEDQQQHIDLNAQLAAQVQKLAGQVQEIMSKGEDKLQLPDISYKDAPASVQAQMERQHGYTPAQSVERVVDKKVKNGATA